jgi:hypothetical protein
MSNPLAAQGYVVLSDGNKPDVTWMIEGIDIEEYTEAQVVELVRAQAAMFNEWNPGEEQADEDDIDQAMTVIKQIWRERKAP